MGDREELLGADVIVVSRMMKNDVEERSGVRAYALLTEAATDAMKLGDLCAEMIPYTAT